MMLALSLCFGGCASGPGLPSVGEAGNAVLMALPEGAVIALPNRETAVLARSLFVNELEGGSVSETNGQGGVTNTLPSSGGGLGGEVLGVGLPRPIFSGDSCVVLKKPLRLASPGYITERDLRELGLLERIEELRLEVQGLRTK
jgi:hypothetical protein